MTSETRSKDWILQRIRSANGRAATAETAQAGWRAIPREYKREGAQEHEAVLELLEDRLRDYDAAVIRAERADAARSIAGRLTERGVRRVVVPIGFAAEWLPEGFEFVFDNGLSAMELDGMEGVLTGATVAIAETGTMVLQDVPGQGRRAATLVPDYHLCVVRMADVVETVPEAMERLRRTSHIATTFVSGPSATADIEMTRIKGVHGPRTLDVILIA